MNGSCTSSGRSRLRRLILIVTGIVLPLSAKPERLTAQARAFASAADWLVADSYSAYLAASFEHRFYVDWDDVSAGYPGVADHSASSESNGPALWAGIQIPRLPVMPMFGAYYAAGLAADATLTNGRRVHNDVTDYGVGIGIRIAPFGKRRLSPWTHIAAIYQMNRSTYEEFTSSNSVVLSEDRSHSSWTGSYGIGATYWASPTFGAEVGFSYSTRFKSMDADNSAVLSAGVVYRGSKR